MKQSEFLAITRAELAQSAGKITYKVRMVLILLLIGRKTWVRFLSQSLRVSIATV